MISKKFKYLKEYVEFGGEEVAEPKTKPETKPKPKTPTRPKPKRRSIPTERPGVDDAPLAEVDDVINRFEDLYSDLDLEEKEEIDNYFQEE